MDSKQIISQYTQIINYILNKQLADAVKLIRKMLDICERNDMKTNFETILTTYNYLLQYTFKGVEDPERQTIYRKLQKDLLRLSDRLKAHVLQNKSTEKYYADKRYFEFESVKNNYNLNNLLTQLKAHENIEHPERKQLAGKIFSYLLKTELSTNDTELLQKTARSRAYGMPEKSIMVSALTISLLQDFDIQKFIALYHFYDANQTRVWHRALVGLVLGYYKYDKRISFYPELLQRLDILKDDDEISQNIEHIVLQFIRTKETQQISDKMRDALMNDIHKIQPKIEEKLNLDNILPDKLIEDINPDWEEVFEDAPELLNKMEEFSKMQLEGSDVFMSAFSMLKHFPFFNQPHNWLLPFYKENEDAKKAMQTGNKLFDADTFAEGLEGSSYICNSDKYSFCLNIAMLPSAQKDMILRMFKMEMEAMQDIDKEDIILQKDLKDKHIYTRYIQDLYRFNKLHAWNKGSSLEDIFDTNLDFYNSQFYKTLIKKEGTLRAVAEFYFKKGFYADAVEAFSKLKITDKNARRIYEKTGFAYQKYHDYEKALEFYKKADLYDGNSLWLDKKIAFCYRKLHQYERALDYYRKVEQKQPDNLHTQANIAHCLLYSKQYEEALNHYFKVEYYEPENKKVMRPLAWCSFILNKYDAAEKYYKKLTSDKSASVYDFINYGHSLFCSGKLELAVEQYHKAIKKSDTETVINGIREDKEYFVEKNIDSTIFNLLLDYLKLNTNN